MKKLLIILLMTAPAVIGCRSNTDNQNNNQATPEPVAEVKDTVAEVAVALPEITEPVAYQAWLEIAKSHGLTGKYICPEDCTVSYVAEAENDEGAEG